ncbi:unnamed protein product [Trichogramma brassicae]|uniref:NHR domain-containing protein n=1 Tax=Trichogramma brassicae TaxID=86971 RepID=A0A6H5IG33_9HYME|nr:unnamed protein product [Trichogramma brassicae]
MLQFHRRCGERVNLINDNCTASRSISEYNYGLVFSAEPLRDDEVFQVQIDKKVTIWSGSIEIGVTACDPENTNLAALATDLRHGSWILTGSRIVHNGASIVESYGTDLSTLTEGSILGVSRTSKGELVFYVNDVPQGIAATGVPAKVFAVINMFGNCIQISIVQPVIGINGNVGECQRIEINNDYGMDEASSSSTTNLVTNLNVNHNVLPKNHSLAAIREDRLRFHERVGTLVKLSNNARTAERRNPTDEFNNGVVMTHRPLKDNELFEIRIDKIVDKWSGSIEVGVTTHSPTALEFPATMTNMRSGTTMMSGCGILTNGKGTQREYGEFNLDELREGDRVGMIRKSNSNLHYYINGLDQGCAAKVPSTVWGVIDLYGMTVKVTIVDRDEREEQNLITRRNTLQLQGINETGEPEEVVDRLMFHACCGTRADVINNGRTAHRPNAIDDFNNGVVLTSRPLRPNELFEVRLDKIVTKWAGSIEIGVTTHSPTELEFPFTMTNVRSGTWMMTGNGVMHNGTTMIDHYGQNLDRLQVGDRVGVMRKDNSTLHFYVNGTDQGVAATGVPVKVYGVIDLYGQAAQATIVDNSDFCSPTTINSSISNTTLYCDLRFHHVHGRNARITNNGLTASRPRALGEFNDAIVIANRALRDGEMFEVVIDKMVDRWSGAIEAGVTAIRPDELEFPSTMTDIDYDTWMLSGMTVMLDGAAVRNNYACDLDKLCEGNRIGMMRWPDGSLHYYLDGVDQGAACTGLPAHVYPVIDLYGQCAQTRSSYGANLETLRAGSTVGLLLDEDSRLHLYIDGLDQGIAFSDLPANVYAVVDLYGQCEQISISGTSNPTCTETTDNELLTNMENLALATELEDVENSREKADLEYHEKESQSAVAVEGMSLNNEMVIRNEYDTGEFEIDSESDASGFRSIAAKNIVRAYDSSNSNCAESSGTLLSNIDIPDNDENNILAESSACSHVKLNNATNINIRNDAVLSTANMSSINEAITSSNANNAINESIASNASLLHNNMNNVGGLQSMTQSSNTKSWDVTNLPSPAAVTAPRELVLNLHRNSLSFSQTLPNNCLTTSSNVLPPPPSVSVPSTPLAQPSKRCEYLKACMRLKSSLVLPDEYFSLDETICYCSSCFKVDSESAICKKGEPVAEFAVPVGWVRFPLKHSVNANQIPQSTTDKWHVAFYATRIDAIRCVLQ